VDTKHARFNLVVSSDDRDIEKKDKTIDEPCSSTPARTRPLRTGLNSIDKNKVSGYLPCPRQLNRQCRRGFCGAGNAPMQNGDAMSVPRSAFAFALDYFFLAGFLAAF